MTFHTVTDPRHVREVLRRTDDFAPHNALTSVTPLGPEALRILTRARFALPPVLASATGSEHRRVRALVAAYFSPAKVAAIEPRVRELTAQRCLEVRAKLDEHGSADLVREVSRHVPPRIMGDLIGIDCPDLDTLNEWSRDSLELFWGWPDPGRQLDLAHSAADFYRWLRGEVKARRDDDSLFATLRRAGLGDPEICSLGYFLVIAGQETTAQLISIALHRTLRPNLYRPDLHRAEGQPDAWAEIAAGASGTAHIRETLATQSSVPTWRRLATSDTVVAGERIPAGAEILLSLTGHHGDGDTRARETAYTLAFGHGLHRCLGARLAELEAVAVLEETARALPELALTGPDPQWLRLLSFQSPLSVVVTRRS